MSSIQDSVVNPIAILGLIYFGTGCTYHFKRRANFEHPRFAFEIL